MKEGSLLFVYGTLRRGASSDLSRNPRVDFISSDSINGGLYNLGWFPGVKEIPVSDEPQQISGTDATPQYFSSEAARRDFRRFNPGEASIRGDVFKILDDDVVAHLDAYEGYPTLYNRVETETADGRHVWVYTYNHEVTPEMRISSGDWLNIPDTVTPTGAG